MNQVMHRNACNASFFFQRKSQPSKYSLAEVMFDNDVSFGKELCLLNLLQNQNLGSFTCGVCVLG